MVKKNTLVRNITLVAGVLVLMILIVLLVGKTFGFFQYTKKGETTNVISISGIDVKIINNTDNNLNLTAYPMYDSEGLLQDSFDISIKNTSKRPIDYTLKVLNDEDKQDLNNLLSTEYIRFSYKIGNGTWSEPATLGGANNNIIYSETVNGRETRTVSIKLWVSSEAPNSVQGTEFYGKLMLTGEKALSPRCDTSGNSTNDIRMWLACGNVNEDYTTIQEVLNDTTTLQTLINSNQANYYLVLSTDWINPITSNEQAMTYIGSNDVLADTLYNDSNWGDAIINSQYFDKVLKPLIPIMTSNTTPSGQASGSTGRGNNGPWKAFDGLNNSYDDAYISDAVNGDNTYITYKFDTPIVTKKAYICVWNNIAGAQTVVHKVYGSNDNSNFTELGSLTLSLPAESSTHKNGYACGNTDLIGNDEYLYYKFMRISGTDRNIIGEANILGR